MSSTSIRVRPLSRTARTISDPSRTRGARPCRTRVLHERLDDEQRHAGIGDVGREVDGDLEPIGEARALNLEVALDDLQLLAQRRVTIAGVEHVAEQIAEARPIRRTTPAVSPGARQRGDAVQAVEEEVRLEVSAQCLQPRRRQLGLEPRGRDLPILVALVERHGRAGAGNRRVDEQLRVQPSAQLHHEALPHRHVSGSRAPALSSVTTKRLRERDGREHRQVREQEPQPPAEPLGQPAARELPHAIVKGIQATKIRGLPCQRAPHVHALAGRLRDPQRSARPTSRPRTARSRPPRPTPRGGSAATDARDRSCFDKLSARAAARRRRDRLAAALTRPAAWCVARRSWRPARWPCPF